MPVREASVHIGPSTYRQRRTLSPPGPPAPIGASSAVSVRLAGSQCVLRSTKSVVASGPIGLGDRGTDTRLEISDLGGVPLAEVADEHVSVRACRPR